MSRKENSFEATWCAGRYAAFGGSEDGCDHRKIALHRQGELPEPRCHGFNSETIHIKDDDFQNGASALHAKLGEVESLPRFYLCETDTGWCTYPIVVRVGATRNVIVALALRVVLGIRMIIAEIFVVIVF